MVGLTSGLVLADDEKLVMEIEAELWATSSNPIARFIGGIKKFIAMIFGFRKKGFLVITDSRVVEISERVGCWCVPMGRTVKNLLPSSVKEIGYVRKTTCGCFCPAYYLYYEAFTQRTVVQMKGADESGVLKAADAFYSAICAADADSRIDGLIESVKPSARSARLEAAPGVIYSNGGIATKNNTSLPVIVSVAMILGLIAAVAGFVVLSGHRGANSGSWDKKVKKELVSSPKAPQQSGLEPIRVTKKELFYIPIMSGNGFYKYVTLEGKEITEAKYIRAYVFQEGRALVQRRDSLWGYIDMSGNPIGGAYKQALSFKDGTAWVNDNGTIKALSLNGKITKMLPNDILSVWSYYDGMALFSKDGGQGYMDKNYNAIGAGRLYADGNRFQEGAASVTCDNGRYGYIDANANFIIGCDFDEAKVFKNSMAIVHGDDGWGVINKRGNYIFGPFNAVEMINPDERMFKFKQNGKWGWLDSEGAVVISPVYEDIMSFDDREIAPVKQDGKWGYIDKDGAYVIDRQYDAAYPFFNNRALVKINDVFVTVDKNGAIDLRTGSQRIDPSYWNFINSGIVGGPRIMSAEPSFKCDAAGLSDAEKMICRSVRLAELDKETNDLYKRASGSNKSAANSQKEFLAKRNRCRTVDCIESAYEFRKEELNDL